MMTPLLLAALMSAQPPTPPTPTPTPTPTTTTTSEEPAPSESLYQIDGTFEDEHGAPRVLRDFTGTPVMLAMVYASCPRACPLLIADVKRMLALLGPDQTRLRVVLVTLDPKRDTVEVLARTLRERGLDAAHTSFLRSDPTTTRTLAAALGVRYRQDADGAIDHNSKIVLLGNDGVVVAQQDGLGRDTTAFVAAARAAVSAH